MELERSLRVETNENRVAGRRLTGLNLGDGELHDGRVLRAGLTLCDASDNQVGVFL